MAEYEPVPIIVLEVLVKYISINLHLIEEFAKWEDLNRDNLEDKSEYKVVEHLNLYNAIARKRFELIELNKKKIF